MLTVLAIALGLAVLGLAVVGFVAIVSLVQLVQEFWNHF